MPSLPPKIFSKLAKTPEKQKSNFSRSMLFHNKTSVCLKYFFHKCKYKVKNLRNGTPTKYINQLYCNTNQKYILLHFLTEIPCSIFPSRPINANKPKLIFATVKYGQRNNKSITNKQKLSQTTMFWLK